MTPLQIEYHSQHKARLQRFAKAAYDKKLQAATLADEDQARKLDDEWKERQKSIPVPRQWFTLVATIGKVETGNITVSNIIKAACRHFDYSQEDLLKPGRFKEVVHARHVVMYLARALIGKSYPEIGRRLGGLDHTTSIYGVRKIANALRSNAAVAYDVAHIEAMLEGML